MEGKLKPQMLSMFKETNRRAEQEFDKVHGWTCECYGQPCDCDRSCDASDPCQSCVSGQ